MKKWSDKELKLSIKYINDGLCYDEIAKLLGRTKKSIRIKLNKMNFYSKPKNFTVEKKCGHCEKKFISLISENRKYCSQSCSAKENNKIFIKRVKLKITKTNEIIPKKFLNCLNCGCEVRGSKKKYCNLNCFQEHRKKQYHNQIEIGNINLPARQYKNYLIEKYGNNCMECGWNKKNLNSGTIPIELEHIDGNSFNNELSNLKLLCPNCHSLTSTYKGANKGKGRFSRKIRYNEGKSY